MEKENEVGMARGYIWVAPNQVAVVAYATKRRSRGIIGQRGVKTTWIATWNLPLPRTV